MRSFEGSLSHELKKVAVNWHRSRAIYTFDSTYPYNTVKAFFWKARRGDFEDWFFDDEKMTVFDVESIDAKEIKFKNGIFIYRRETEAEPTVIEISELKGKSIFQVIITGDPEDQAGDEIKEFFRILHRKIDLSRATKRLIYSEQFIRYDESKEHEVRKAITTLYKLFGFALTEMRQKAESGQDVIFLSRAMLNLNGNTVHVKTYRPKKYRSPAQSIFDHPKLEVTVYYEKSELPKKELEQLARDLIASIVQHLDLYDDIIQAGFSFNYQISGYGDPNPDIVKALKLENLKFKLEQLDGLEKCLLNENARRIAKYLAENGGKTSKEISRELGINHRTVRYHLKKLKDSGIISNCRRGNSRFYHLRV